MADSTGDSEDHLEPERDAAASPGGGEAEAVASGLESRIANLAPEVVAFMQHHCGDAHLGADLAHDAVARALRTVRSLRDPNALRGWVFRIAINRFNDHLRRERPMEVVELDSRGDLERTELGPDRRLLAAELDEVLRRELAALPERQRTVLMLHGVRELSHPSIAELLGISLDAVKMSLFHAREKMRVRLAGYLDSVPAKRNHPPRKGKKP